MLQRIFLDSNMIQIEEQEAAMCSVNDIPKYRE